MKALVSPVLPARLARVAIRAWLVAPAALALLFLALAPPALAQEESAGAKAKGKAAAAEAAGEDAEAPPADPFVKPREASADPAREAEGGAHTNVGALFQYIDVPRERWQGWLAANEIAADAGALRREADEWIAAGEGELAETSLVMGRSGQRMRVESILPVIYASEFDPSDASSQPFPGLSSKSIRSWVGTAVSISTSRPSAAPTSASVPRARRSA